MKKTTVLILICLFTVLNLTANNQEPNASSKAITTFPWQESFESTTFPPTDWTAETNDASGDGWERNNGSTHGPGNVIDGTYAAMADVYNISKNSVAKLKTPVLQLAGLTSPKLKLHWQCTTGSGQDPVFIIKMSTDNGQNFSEIYNQAADGIADKWTEIDLELTGASNETILSFEVISDYGMKNLFIDKVQVYEPAPMQFVSAKSFQNNNNVISIGSSKNDILGINIKTQGALNKLSVTDFSLDLNQTTSLADISKIQLYYTGNTNSYSDASLFSESTNIQNTLSLSGSTELAEGDNYFWLTLDINPDATQNNTVDALCSQITIGTNNHAVEAPAPDGSRELKKILNMPAGSNIITINENLTFYDDGGATANYSENFEGTITFGPKTPGKILKIEWEAFEIFNTSSTGKNDIFKIYHGNTVDENKLIGTYSEMPPSIYSMDANGKITIYFKVNTGLPKSGWKATVTETNPANMIFNSATTMQQQTATVAESEQNAEILKIEINTQNTLNPLNAESFNFSTSGSTNVNDISSAKLYYTANKNTFSTNNLVGEQNKPDGEFTITGSQPLTVGKNYFWLAYSISNLATQGNTVDAECSIIKINGENKTPSVTAPTGSRTIDNTYRMPKTGTLTKTIYQELPFTDDNEGLGGKYSFDANGIVTFIPANTGEKIKLDISSFDVLYQDSPSGTKAVFKIFNGNSTSTADILWKADETNCTTGPGAIITSTADNGELTVQFVGNAYASSQTKAGWEGIVWSEIPKNMEFKSVELTQETDIIKPGSIDQQILAVKLKLSGTLNPVNSTIFTFNTNGTTSTADLRAAKLYFTGKNNTFSTATPVGSEISSPNGEFNFTCTNSLEEGNNYFWLVYNINSTATLNNAVDAELTKIKIKETTHSITNGAPGGNRIIKNIYNMGQGTHDIYINETPLSFYDRGGISGKYTKNCEDTVRFIPLDNTQKARLEISKLQLYSMDKIFVYNGLVAEKENLLIKMDGDENITTTDDPYIFKSTAENGELTVVFKSYSWSTPKDGWEASIYSFIPKAIYFKDNELSQLNHNPVLKNEQNAEILQVKLNFAGETTPAQITSFNFTTGQSSAIADIKKASLYFSNETSKLNIEGSTLIGETTPAQDGSISFTGNITIDKESGFYFWLVYDIAENAQAGNFVDAEIIDFTINGTKHTADNGNPAGNRKIIAGMQGEYTIAQTGSGDYISFVEAISDLTKRGIEKNVTFLIEDGVYVETIEIPQIQGASSENAITFKAKNGIKENVKLLYHKNISSSGDVGILALTGVDHIKFENITFKTTNKTYDGIVIIRNQSRDIHFESCYFEAPFCTGYSDISAIDTDAENTANQNNDRLTINNCEFNGGATALSLSGTGYVVLPKEYGHKITNCTFKNQGRKVAWFDNQKDITFDNNLIIIDNSGISEMIAVVGYKTIGNSVFSNNTIRSGINKDVTAFQFRPAKGTSLNPVLVYNNIINLQNAANNSCGIEFDDASAFTGVYFNTIVITGTASNTAALRFSGGTSDSPGNITVKNNLFINRGGAFAILLNNKTFYNGITFDYNNLFTSGGNLCKNGADLIANLNNWQTLATSANSISENPEFYSETDLHLKSVGNLNAGLKINTILIDIDKETRSETTPTLGADEFSEPNTNAPVFANGYPSISNINHLSAFLNVNTDKNGLAYFVVLAKNATAPSVNQVISGTDANDNPVDANLKAELEFYKNKTASSKITNLNSHTEYDVYVVVKDNLNHISASVSKVSFQTEYKPTEPSIFELIATASDNFEDGTAYFTGVSVVEGTGATQYSNKQIKIAANQTANISLTNTSNGLTLNGFFLKSASVASIKGIKADATYTDIINTTVTTEWEYLNLRNLGKAVGVEITAGTEILYIDDFSSLPLDLKINPIADVNINAGENTSLEAIVSGGVKPYTFEWTPAGSLNNAGIYNPTATPANTTEYHVKVNDAFGSAQTEKVIVNVSSNQASIATFDDLTLEPESHWKGNPEQENSIFYSGAFSFNNYYNESIMTWMGFAYSNETSTEFDPSNYLQQQFRSAVGSGASKSQNYAVSYAYGFVPEINLTNTSEGETLKGTYITNTAYALSSMLNGDSFIGGAFEKGDWYKVTFSGRDKDGNLSSSLDIYLADFRSDNPEEHYILDYWKWVDLSSLGKVQKIYFSVSGSRNNDLGLLIPAYFCLDNFNSTEEDTAPYVKNKPKNPVIDEEQELAIDLTKVFTDCDNDDKNITYSIKSISDNSLANVSLNNKVLSIKALDEKQGIFTITIEVLSNGKTCELTLETTINLVDDAPVVANTIADITVLQKSENQNMDISNVFDDKDNDNNKITITAQSADLSLVVVTITNKNLELAFANDNFGQTNITLEANSNGKTVQTSFKITITENNPLAEYSEGVFIVNEGWFGHDEGSVNFMNKQGKVNYRAYMQKNKSTLGTTTQFGTIYGDNFYLVSKQGKILIVADAINLEKKAEIEKFTGNEDAGMQGRAFVGINPGKAYISTSNGIYLFDINTLSVTGKLKNINTEIGNMLYVNKHVFAVSKDTVFVIDAQTDKIHKKISGGKYGGITYTINGYTWVGADTSLLKIDSENINFEYIKLPTNAKIPGSGWAWNAGSLCSGIEDNSLYWTETGYSPKKIYKYNGDTSLLKQAFIEVKPQGADDLVAYGAGLRINPENNEIIFTAKKDGWGDNAKQNYLIKYNGNTAEEISRTKLYEHFWFPAMPVFTDEAPVVATAISDISATTNDPLKSIDISNLFMDNDNYKKLITKTIAKNTNPGIAEVILKNNTLNITFKAEGKTNITIEAISNGKIITTSFNITVNNATGINTPNSIAVNIYPNPVKEIATIECEFGLKKITVYNSIGNLVEVLKLKNKNNCKINFSGLPAGTYFINIENNNGKITKTIIKQ